MTAVCVDDQQMQLDKIVRILRENGVNVLATAQDATSGLAAVMKHRPTFATLDIQMSQGSGLDILRAMQADPTCKTIPIMLSSMKQVTRQLGDVPIISKPYDDIMTWRKIAKILADVEAPTGG